MKKSLTILIFLLMVFPIISAVNITMKDEFSQGETLFATVDGNFIDSISKPNIYFYREHVRIALDYDVVKIQDKYYIYAQLENKLPDNYSIAIKGVRYYVGSQISEDNLAKYFEINSDIADFSVNPGFAITEEDFEFELENLQSSEITIEIQTETTSGSSEGFFDFLFGTQELESSVTLLPEEIKNLNVNFDDINETTIRTVTLSTDNLEYNIPVYVIVSSKSTTNCGNNILESGEECDGDDLNSETCTNLLGENWNGELFCNLDCTFNSSSCFEVNETNETSENETKIECLINWNCDEDEECVDRKCVKVSEENETNANQTQNEGESEEDYEIVVEDDGNLIVVKDGEVTNESASLKNCNEIENGNICSSSQICDGNSVYAKDNVCCVGSCIIQEENDNKKLIGWIILGVVFILIISLFRKFKSSGKRKKDLLLRRH